jgi:hypothetical protein
MSDNLINHWEHGKPTHSKRYFFNHPNFWLPDDGDSEELFDQNHPPGWGKNDIRYTINSWGFRSPEFDLTGQTKCVMTFGCSFTLGVGVDDNQNWPMQMRKFLPDYTIYNLGISGCGADTVARYAINWIPILKPEIVMILWPDVYRFETYDRDPPYTNGPWEKGNVAFNEFYKDENAYNNSMKNKVTLDLLQKIHGFKYLSKDFYKINEMFQGDNAARDMHHPGPNWYGNLADYFNKELQKL